MAKNTNNRRGLANNSPLKSAINLLCKVIKINSIDIVDTERLVEGYSNDSYKIDTKSKGSYFVRIGRDCLALNRGIEGKILNVLKNYDLDLIYFDPKTGNQIRHWINGVNPTTTHLTSLKFYSLLAEKIRQLHSIDLSSDLKKQKMDYHLYDAYWNKLDHKYFVLFQKILDQYLDQPMVFSHNDLTPWNVIYDAKSKKVTLIDYEWAGYNWPIFDVANFVRDADIHSSPLEHYFLSFFSDQFQYDDVLNFIFVSCCYSYLWTYSVELTDDITKYRERVFKKLVMFYQEINKINDYQITLADIWKQILQHKRINPKKYQLKSLTTNATNQSYLLTFDENHQYVLRIGNIEIDSSNRKNEAIFIQKYAKRLNHEVLYFNSIDGSAITKYKQGNTPSVQQLTNHEFLNQLINQLESVHHLPADNKILKIDWHAYDQYIHLLDTKYIKLFHSFIAQLNPQKFCLTHGDCTPWNMVYDSYTKKLSLIDYEWIRINHPLFDYANFLREANLSQSKTKVYLCKKLNVSLKKMDQMIYISAVYAYLYMCGIKSYKNQKQYLINQKKLIRKLYDKLT